MANERLKQITTKAKQLYKSGKYKKWTDAIKAARKQLPAAKKSSKKKDAVKKVAIKKVVTKKVGRKIASVKKHSVNGIQSTINGLKRKYIALFESKNTIETAYFEATSLTEAKRLASFHKRHSPEFKGKSIRVKVKLAK